MGKGARKEFCCDTAYYGGPCNCAALWQEKQNKRSRIQHNYSPGTIIHDEYYGSGKVLEINTVEEKVKVQWKYYQFNDGIMVKTYDECMKYRSVCRNPSDAGYSYEFKKGAIIECLSEPYARERVNYANRLTRGLIIDVSPSQQEIKVLWDDLITESVLHYKEEPYVKVILSEEKAKFNSNFKKDTVIDFRNGSYATIAAVSNDARELNVYWEGTDYSNCKEGVTLSYFKFYSDYDSEEVEFLTVDEREEQLRLEDQYLDYSCEIDPEDEYNYDDYDGDY